MPFFHDVINKSGKVLGSVKDKTVKATKGPVEAVSFMTKHKTWSIKDLQETPQFQTALDKFTNLHSTLTKTNEDISTFISSMRSVSYSCAKLGTDFSNLVIAGDPVSATRCADAYDALMKEIDDGIRKPSDNRLVNEVISSIAARMEEMEHVKTKIEARVQLKREFAYYDHKVSQLKSKAMKDKNVRKDALKLPRNESKLEEARLSLKAVTDELLIMFDKWERARPNLLKVEFETLRSVQKQYFTSVASSLKNFVVTSPSEPGGGLSIEQIAALSDKQPLDLSDCSPSNRSNEINSFTGLPNASDDSNNTTSATKKNSDAFAFDNFITDMPSAPTTLISGAHPVSVPSHQPDQSIHHMTSAATTNLGSRMQPVSLPAYQSDQSTLRHLPRCRANYPFESRIVDELSIVVGDEIEIIQKNDDGWWKGKLNGKVGMFPANYTSEL